MSNRNRGRKLVTDKNTDYLFDWFVNSDKFNEQLKGEWDERIAEKLEKHKNPKLDSRIFTDTKSLRHVTEKNRELPTHTINDTSNNVAEFNNDESSESSSSGSDSSAETTTSSGAAKAKTKTPFHKRIDSKPPSSSEKKESRPRIETPEERRARGRDAYAQLENLVKKYGVQLSKHYTIDDDPDEMEEEYKMRKEMRNKEVQVKFYKQVLLNIVCGVEFLNEKYDPFEFKLKDWSKTVAADMDDYTEVLEEIYEKYKNKGGNMPPEIRLLFMIIMSGVTYHISKVLFGDEGLTATIKNNPNVLNKLLSGFLTNKTNASQEPLEAKTQPPNSKNILDAIKRQNKQAATVTSLSTETVTVSPTNDGSLKDIVKEQQMDLEKQLAKQKLYYEEQIRERNNNYQLTLNQMKLDQQNKMIQLRQDLTKQFASSTVPVSVTAPATAPTLIHPTSVIQPEIKAVDDEDIFAFEGSPLPPKTVAPKLSIKKSLSASKKGLLDDDLIDSLDGGVSDNNSIINSTKKNTKNKSTRSPTKSITKSIKNPKSVRSPTRSSTRSETKTESRKSNVVKL